MGSKGVFFSRIECFQSEHQFVAGGSFVLQGSSVEDGADAEEADEPGLMFTFRHVLIVAQGGFLYIVCQSSFSWEKFVIVKSTSSEKTCHAMYLQTSAQTQLANN